MEIVSFDETAQVFRVTLDNDELNLSLKVALRFKFQFYTSSPSPPLDYLYTWNQTIITSSYLAKQLFSFLYYIRLFPRQRRHDRK